MSINLKAFDKNWFGLYDEELQCLDMIHLSYVNAEKWANLANNYEQTFIEDGSYKVMFFRRLLNGYK